MLVDLNDNDLICINVTKSERLGSIFSLRGNQLK